MLSDDEIVRDLEIMSDAENYNAWLYGQFSAYLGRRIVEVGAGIGNFTSRFLDRDLVVAVDVHDSCIAYLRKKFVNDRNVVPLNLDIASPQAAVLADYKPDTVICINVLEHVQDDMRALENIHQTLVAGGRLALLVPAFGFLYGTIDQLVGHRRRYVKKELQAKLVKAGFIIRALYYMNSFGVFGWLLNNRLLRIREESPAQVKFYDRTVVPWLSVAERIVRPPFGLSLVAIAEKSGR